MQKKEYSLDIGGKRLTAIFSDIAEKASGSVILSYGNTTVLATAVMSGKKREGMDFFPLVVDYEEKYYAAGEILGSQFIRREGRPSDEAVLGGRVIDRTIRPLFDKRIRNDVQIVITVLSVDEDDPDVLAVNAASLALATSDIPWAGPVSAVRIGKKDNSDEHIVNPTYAYRNDPTCSLDAIVCGKADASSGVMGINMVEVGAKEAGEEAVDEVFEKALEDIAKIQEFQKKIIAEIGKEKQVMELEDADDELKKLFEESVAPKLEQAVFVKPGDKHADVRGEWLELYKKTFPEKNPSPASDYYEMRVDEMMHQAALAENKRVDGRAMDEIRPLYAQAGGISPVLHGSGLFYRGQTHVLAILTLGGPGDAQVIEGMEARSEKRFMHHYNFPPFSAGETGRIGGMNRRMIGHGALVEKALAPVLPTQEEFPYTIRIVSEVLSSNGSTSMGSVSAATIALMDAGVPIAKPISGMAMGLILGDEKNYKILTDIQGPEDHHGDMDFKVAGTRDGITAIQMDVKVDSIPVAILKDALRKAKSARLRVLDVIEEEISSPRTERSVAAPSVIVKKAKPEQIGLIIGPSGKTIRGIVERTGAEIDVKEDGTVFITGKNGAAENAAAAVEDILHEYKAGDRAEGEVSRILDFGAFVKLSPYAEGLVHISELAPVHINRVDDLVKVGDKVPVVVKEIDEKKRINLSIKKADSEFFNEKLKNLPAQSERPQTRPERRPHFRANRR